VKGNTRRRENRGRRKHGRGTRKRETNGERERIEKGKKRNKGERDQWRERE
jgi:hypothetical protein